MKDMWKRTLTAGILLVIGAVMIWYMKGENKSATQSIFVMDTYMDITAYGRNSEVAVQEAVEEIRRLDTLLSTGSNTSEVSILNQEKEGQLSGDYAYLLKRSMELWNTTDGAFDITVYPLMKAWGFVGRKYRVPADEEIEALLGYVDASKICLNEETNWVILPEQMEIDFGGIAKGYTSARIAQIMKDNGIKNAMVNLGGNVQTVGTKTDGSLWKIAIKSPYDTLPYLGVLSVSDKAVISSGGYERFFEEDGIKYHHIIDPNTGKPAQNGLISVTIVCEDGTLADGLSTSLYVMGRDKAIAFWQKHRDEFDAVLCDEQGKLYVTEGLKDFFSTELEYEIIS